MCINSVFALQVALKHPIDDLTAEFHHGDKLVLNHHDLSSFFDRLEA